MASYLSDEGDAFDYLSERYEKPLDEAEKLTIGNNLVAFFDILNEWDMKQKEQEDQTNGLEAHDNQKEADDAETVQNKEPALKKDGSTK